MMEWFVVGDYRNSLSICFLNTQKIKVSWLLTGCRLSINSLQVRANTWRLLCNTPFAQSVPASLALPETDTTQRICFIVAEAKPLGNTSYARNTEKIINPLSLSFTCWDTLDIITQPQAISINAYYFKMSRWTLTVGTTPNTFSQENRQQTCLWGNFKPHPCSHCKLNCDTT